MARKRLLECSFLIPVRQDRNLSDGRVHATTTWAWLEDGLSQFGGATREAGFTRVGMSIRIPESE